MPLGFVHRLAQLGQVVGRIPCTGVDDVLPVALRRVDVERRIVFPLVGVADLHGKGSQFLLGTGLGLVRHPIEGIDMLRKGSLEVLYQLQHAGFVLLGEVLGHIHLAHGFGKRAVGHRHGALPTRFHLLLPGHRTTEEVERRKLEIVAQIIGGRIDVLCSQIVADVVERRRFQQFVGVVERREGSDDDRVEVADAERLVIGRPIDGIVALLEIGFRGRIVLSRDIAQLDVRPHLLGQFGLDVHDSGHCLFDFSFRNAGQGENFRQISLVGRAELLVLSIQIIIAVAHHQPRLRRIERIHGTVHQIGFDTDREERIGHARMERSDSFGQLRPVVDGQNFFHSGLDRHSTLGVEPCRIETHLIEVGNLLLD